jgi:acyl-CoA synthetase (AMP-forming)/AMP-acid ligase II
MFSRATAICPSKTARAFTADGWFRTGDIGHFEDGFLYVAGRLSTLIKTESGEKVQTEDVESAYAKEAGNSRYRHPRKKRQAGGVNCAGARGLRRRYRSWCPSRARESVAPIAEL